MTRTIDGMGRALGTISCTDPLNDPNASITDTYPGSEIFDLEGFRDYLKPPLLDLHKYLYEKEQMGLFRKLHFFRIEEGYCARIGIMGLRIRTTYNKILLPAMEKIVDVVSRNTIRGDTIIQVQELSDGEGTTQND